MREHEEEFAKKGAQLVAVGLGDANYARQFREDTGIKFPLLIDEKKDAYQAAQLGKASILHLLKKENAVARRRAKAEGHSQHKLGKDPFQLGGSFVFLPGNVDRYGHISQTFGDNAAVADLLAALS